MAHVSFKARRRRAREQRMGWDGWCVVWCVDVITLFYMSAKLWMVECSDFMWIGHERRYQLQINICFYSIKACDQVRWNLAAQIKSFTYIYCNFSIYIYFIIRERFCIPKGDQVTSVLLTLNVLYLNFLFSYNFVEIFRRGGLWGVRSSLQFVFYPIPATTVICQSNMKRTLHNIIVSLDSQLFHAKTSKCL